MTDTPIWTPSPARIAGTRMDAFRRHVNAERGLDLADVPALQAWSVTDLDGFWTAVWAFCGVVGERGTGPAYVPGDSFTDARFFEGARVNYAENLLVGPADQSAPALLGEREDGRSSAYSWTELRAAVAAAAAALKAEGVGPGDKVAAWMPNIPETTIVMLATLSLGAVFSSTSPDFGTTGVVDRFGQIEPKVLIAADGYPYAGKRHDCLARLKEIRAKLPTVTRVVLVSVLSEQPVQAPDVPGAMPYAEWVAPHQGAPLSFTRVSFDHPGFILYSSGTTGKPKCFVHRANGLLLKHLTEHQLHCDLKEGDMLFFFTTCGWMMWNWEISALASKAAVVTFEGSPFHPTPVTLLDIADTHRVTHLGISPKFIDTLAKNGLSPRQTHKLDRLRTIITTGSPLTLEGFQFAYSDIKADMHLAPASGGTDLCGCFIAGDPTRPVFAGEMQMPSLGMAVDVFDDAGKPVAAGVKGELVCTAPFPSMPLGFLGDTDGAKYHSAYFERYDGIWHHGDFAAKTPHGGMVIFGRSDATLNVAGVRIGTAEIYRVVEQFPEILESIAIGQDWDGDTRMILFIRMQPGHRLTDDLMKRVRTALREQCSPRHMPAKMVEVSDIPRTRNNKLVELTVADVVNGRQVRNLEALANPEALDLYRNLPDLAT